MNSGNFGKHGINLHALELALRSKRRWWGGGRGEGGGSVVGVSEKKIPLCIQSGDFATSHIYFHNDTEGKEGEGSGGGVMRGRKKEHQGEFNL